MNEAQIEDAANRLAWRTGMDPNMTWLEIDSDAQPDSRPVWKDYIPWVRFALRNQEAIMDDARVDELARRCCAVYGVDPDSLADAEKIGGPVFKGVAWMFRAALEESDHAARIAAQVEPQP
jgi:hypothetical protein